MRQICDGKLLGDPAPTGGTSQRSQSFTKFVVTSVPFVRCPFGRGRHRKRGEWNFDVARFRGRW